MAYYSSKLWGKKKAWNIEAFIAPENFDPSSQPLNIVTVFGNYDNVNKAYIYSFSSAIATLTLPVSSGVTYRWGETISGVDYVYDVVSGTAFTAGSTKRYVIVNSTEISLSANISKNAGFNGAVWLYCSSKIYQVFAQSNTYLKYVHLESLNSITTIENYAFASCTNLTGTLTIPNSVTTIGQSAFYNCTGFTGTLTIPNSVTTIGNNAFVSCIGLTGTLTIPNSVTTIGIAAFQNCTGFTGALTIANSVTTIGINAFVSCTGFTGSLTIPNSVTTIGASAFANISFTHLVSHSIYFEVYDEVLYTTTGTITAIYSAKGYSGTLTLKTNVVVIGYNCFYSNNLRTGTLTIPNSVTTIGNNAFYNCNKLSGIGTINGSPAIGTAVFYFCTLISEWHITSPVAPSVQLTTWGNYAKPLHVKIGATGYNVAPWTDTTIFSAIIYDL